MTDDPYVTARKAMRTNMARAVKSLIGNGYVNDYYYDMAGDFVGAAEEFAEEVGRAEAEARQAQAADATSLAVNAAVRAERKRARLARLRQRRANRTHLYRYLGSNHGELTWQGPAVDSRSEVVSVSADYFWSGGKAAGRE